MKMDERFDDELMDDSSSKAKKHKIMTMSDVSECLQKDFAEEMADTKKYLRMAEVVDNAGNDYDSHYLLEMARDEYTHACFIHDFMERYEVDIPEEQEACYVKLKEEVAEFFRA